ncbi:MAG: hypothetical protein JNM19_12790 [Chitinophagaceae bacterium]|nr:hypothetical protein [Chitinophagaceae bacterium]
MKKLLIISLTAFLFSCKSGKKEDKPADKSATTEQTNSNPDAGTTTEPAYTPNTNSFIMVEGKELKLSSSILVDKDKNKLKAGAPYRAMITTSSGPDNEGLILRFVFDTKPGTYPLTGFSYGRGKGDAGQQFGGLLGGQEKIYPNNVTLTEVKDMGDNGAGGHKWNISGTIENLTIPAMGIMLMDKEKNHPKEIKIDKISFTGLSFDDNAEEMLQKAMDQMNQMKKNK